MGEHGRTADRHHRMRRPHLGRGIPSQFRGRYPRTARRIQRPDARSNRLLYRNRPRHRTVQPFQSHQSLARIRRFERSAENQARTRLARLRVERCGTAAGKTGTAGRIADRRGAAGRPLFAKRARRNRCLRPVFPLRRPSERPDRRRKSHVCRRSRSGRQKRLQNRIADAALSGRDETRRRPRIARRNLPRLRYPRQRTVRRRKIRQHRRRHPPLGNLAGRSADFGFHQLRRNRF